MKHVIDSNFIVQQYGALMLIAFGTLQLLWCKIPIFLSFWVWPKNGPELNSNDDEIQEATQQQQHELSVTKLNKLSQRQSKSGSALILHVREKMQFLHFSISPGSAEILVSRGGITNDHSIAYLLSNISAKNYQNWLMCVEVIVCNISVIF